MKFAKSLFLTWLFKEKEKCMYQFDSTLHEFCDKVLRGFENIRIASCDQTKRRFWTVLFEQVTEQGTAIDNNHWFRS